MRILITSGGTKVPIDQVRDITNMSKGTFGSRIAHAALKLGHSVCFFHAEGSCTPFSQKFDFYKDDGWDKAINQMADLYNFCHKHRPQYAQSTFRNFDDYETGLQLCLAAYLPDIVILSAAVSDYGVTNFVDGKLRTQDDEQIHLTPLPKIIHKIKQWHPHCMLVGFKLMVNASEEELVFAAHDSITKNGCDLVVANDLASLRQGNHSLILVTRKGHQNYRFDQSDDPYYLAITVVQTVTGMASCQTSYSE